MLFIFTAKFKKFGFLCFNGSRGITLILTIRYENKTIKCREVPWIYTHIRNCIRIKSLLVCETFNVHTDRTSVRLWGTSSKTIFRAPKLLFPLLIQIQKFWGIILLFPCIILGEKVKTFVFTVLFII